MPDLDTRNDEGETREQIERRFQEIYTIKERFSKNEDFGDGVKLVELYQEAAWETQATQIAEELAEKFFLSTLAGTGEVSLPDADRLFRTRHSVPIGFPEGIRGCPTDDPLQHYRSVKSLFLLYCALIKGKQQLPKSDECEAEKLDAEIWELLNMEDQADQEPPYVRPAPAMLGAGGEALLFSLQDPTFGLDRSSGASSDGEAVQYHVGNIALQDGDLERCREVWAFDGTGYYDVLAKYQIAVMEENAGNYADAIGGYWDCFRRWDWRCDSDLGDEWYEPQEIFRCRLKSELAPLLTARNVPEKKRFESMVLLDLVMNGPKKNVFTFDDDLGRPEQEDPARFTAAQFQNLHGSLKVSFQEITQLVLEETARIRKESEQKLGAAIATITNKESYPNKDGCAETLGKELKCWSGLTSRTQEILVRSEMLLTDQNYLGRDFSQAGIGYTKAIEIELPKHLFGPFQAQASGSDWDISDFTATFKVKGAASFTPYAFEQGLYTRSFRQYGSLVFDPLPDLDVCRACFQATQEHRRKCGHGEEISLLEVRDLRNKVLWLLDAWVGKTR